MVAVLIVIAVLLALIAGLLWLVILACHGVALTLERHSEEMRDFMAWVDAVQSSRQAFQQRVEG